MRYKVIIIASIVALLLLVWVIITALRSNNEEAAVEAGVASTVEAEKEAPAGASTGSESPATAEAEAEASSAEEQGASTESTDLAQSTTATALNNLNLRQGPGTNYSVKGSLPKDQTISVVGRDEGSEWLVAKTETGEVWLTADPTLVRVEGQAVAELPVVEAPALSYNVNDPEVDLLLNRIPLVVHNQGSFTCVSHNGLNNLEPLQEGNVIGPHAGDFVYKGNNVLFRYTNGSLQLIRENPLARFEGGAESLPFDQAMQLFQNEEIVWTGELGQNPGRGVTGCDPAIR